MLYCLDTNVIVDLLHGDRNLKLKIEDIEKNNVNFCITPVTLTELFKGAFAAEKREQAIRLVEDFCQSFGLLDFSKEACKIAGEKYAELKKLGKQTQESDLMIASIALSHGAVLLTRNQKHFSNIQGLKLMVV